MFQYSCLVLDSYFRQNYTVLISGGHCETSDTKSCCETLPYQPKANKIALSVCVQPGSL